MWQTPRIHQETRSSVGEPRGFLQACSLFDGRADLHFSGSIGIADVIAAAERPPDRSSSGDGHEPGTEK